MVAYSRIFTQIKDGCVPVLSRHFRTLARPGKPFRKNGANARCWFLPDVLAFGARRVQKDQRRRQPPDPETDRGGLPDRYAVSRTRRTGLRNTIDRALEGPDSANKIRLLGQTRRDRGLALFYFYKIARWSRSTACPSTALIFNRMSRRLPRNSAA